MKVKKKRTYNLAAKRLLQLTREIRSDLKSQAELREKQEDDDNAKLFAAAEALFKLQCSNYQHFWLFCVEHCRNATCPIANLEKIVRKIQANNR